MSNVLVTGSLAYDYIMHFDDIFSRHILPNQLEKLNVSFTAYDMSKNLGGTAGNIAYGIKLLNEKPIIFATAGRDFHEYEQYLQKLDIDTSQIQVLEDELTASAHIITDKTANQITAFHGGAMLKNDISIAPVLDNNINLAILSADGKFGMLRHAKEFKEKQIRYIYDPGHSLPAFEGDEILQLLDGAYIVIVNSYEAELIADKAVPLEELVKKVDYFIVTRGKDGSIIYQQDQEFTVKAAKTDKFFDPTGAGDAYRAGLIKGILHGLPMATSAKLASLTACYAVECAGTQNYNFSIDEFQQRFRENYGDEEVSFFN